MGMNGLFKTNYGDREMHGKNDKQAYQHLLNAVRGKMAAGEEDDFGEGGEGSAADVVADAIESTEEGSPEDLEQDVATAMGAGDDHEVDGEGDDDAMKVILAKIEAGKKASGPKKVGMRMGGAPSPEENIRQKVRGKA